MSFASVFIPFFDMILQFFKIEMQVYEFTFSYWDIFLWTTAVGIILAFIVGFLYD